MRTRNGALTVQQSTFLKAYVENGGDRAKAERKAGYKAGCGYDVLRKPDVQRQIIQHQAARLASDALPIAVSTLIEIMTNGKAPAAARVQASKVVIDRALPSADTGQVKDLHEMTPAELAEAIARLEMLAADAAKDVTQGKDPDLFG